MYSTKSTQFLTTVETRLKLAAASARRRCRVMAHDDGTGWGGVASGGCCRVIAVMFDHFYAVGQPSEDIGTPKRVFYATCHIF